MLSAKKETKIFLAHKDTCGNSLFCISTHLNFSEAEKAL